MAVVHEPSMFKPLKFYCITLMSDGWLNDLTVLHAFQHYFRHIRMVGR